MADDLYDVMGGSGSLFDDDAQEEPIEEAQPAAAGEGSNRTFIIAFGVMAGLLVCALAAFGYWALVLNPKMQADQLAQAAQTAVVETPDVGETVEVPPTETPTPEPTATTPPTATPTPKPTATPTPTPVVGPTRTPGPDETPGAGGDVSSAGTDQGTPTPTPRSRRTETPTPTSPPSAAATERPVATRTTTGTSAEKVPDTGIGEVALGLGAIALLVVLFTARKLRKA